MAALSIQLPFPVFTDSDGQPVEGGYVWIGQANKDPRLHPVNVYFDKDLTIPAGQPLRTVGGYIVHNGSPAQLFIDGTDYSILVQNRKGIDVYSFPSGTGVSPDASAVSYTPAGTGAVATNVQDRLRGYEAPGGSAFIGYQPSGAGAVARTVQAKLREMVSVKDFGAVGDGVTNDTDAFAAASAYINAQGGGTLIIPPGTYIVGKQTFAGAGGLGYAYRAKTIMKFENCTKPVVVLGSGAILKAADELRVGSFNPVTGNPFTPGSLPFVDYNYRADPYWGMIEAYNNLSVSIYGLELDGNIANLVLGGQWGDTGRQIAACGIRAYGNKQLHVENVYTHHHGLDGILIGFNGLTEAAPTYPHTLINVRSEYNARQGLSWVGGNSLTAVGCSFSYTGRATFVSSPGAGVDLEAEHSICRNAYFLNCQFINNTGAGVVADSGDVRKAVFDNCLIIGASNWATWSRKPEMVYRDCKIIGSSVNPFSSSNPSEATKFINCYMSIDAADFSRYGLSSSYSNLVLNFSQADNVLISGCYLRTDKKGFDVRGASIFRDTTVHFVGAASNRTPQDWGALLWSDGNSHPTMHNLTIIGDMTGTLTNPIYVSFNDLANLTATGVNRVINKNANALIKWLNWSWGMDGVFGQNDTPNRYLSNNRLRIHRNAGPTANHGMISLAANDAAPTSGTWDTGDIVFNQNPSASGFIGWVCVAGGTPGTWKTFGAISA